MAPVVIRIVFLIACALSFSSNASSGIARNPTVFVNCGSDGGIGIYDAKWEPDHRYVFSSTKTVETKQSTDNNVPPSIPYTTARVFVSEMVYRFQVEPWSRHILRLHFNLSPFPDKNISQSMFSIVAGNVKLLDAFRPTLAKANKLFHVQYEYILPPSSMAYFNVTFLAAKDCFGFVNGIELLQSPDIFLNDTELVGVGNGLGTLKTGSSNLQTMFRLNIGGDVIQPANDSGGLLRSWLPDKPYLLWLNEGLPQQSMVQTNYKSLSPAIAPPEVYRTARTLGSFPFINHRTNLTWIFKVEGNFMYILRLHFCNFGIRRIFDVLVNNQTVEYMDIGHGSEATPMIKEYAIYVSESVKVQNQEVWVTLRPSKSSKEHHEVILNGIEIFRMAGKYSSLAGPVPSIAERNEVGGGGGNESTATGPLAKSDDSFYMGILVGACTSVAVIMLGVVIYLVKRILMSRTEPLWKTVSNVLLQFSLAGTQNCQYFSLAEIRRATNNFNEAAVIGAGGFGRVYLGILDSKKRVAVKKLNPSSHQGEREFKNEIMMLTKLRHHHLVSLIGFCDEDNVKVLIYDYMEEGTLKEHLYAGRKLPLSWKKRLEILIGAAKGIHYLHNGSRYPIVHRDIKSTNILLDRLLTAKVSDFGLSKIVPYLDEDTTSSRVKGSFGYLDPEYYRRHRLTDKSDVFSFGVILFEVLCARPALDPTQKDDQVYLAGYAVEKKRKHAIKDIMDPVLKEHISDECLHKYTELAEKCVSDSGENRPSMGEVLCTLEAVLSMEEGTGGSGTTSGANKEMEASFETASFDRGSDANVSVSRSYFRGTSLPTHWGGNY